MIKNQQAPEKSSRSTTLEVHSIFHTIQGEGPFAGTPAVFLRLAGCNLQCPACDTDYTSTRMKYSPGRLAAVVEGLAKGGLVVITGGEPFRQDISDLIVALITAGYYVQVETNGTLRPPFRTWAWNRNTHERSGMYIVCSPKTGTVHGAIGEVACAFKYVGAAGELSDEDGLPIRALEHPASPQLARPPEGFKGVVYLQPLDEQDCELTYENTQACVKSCLKHGHVLQLQIHKIIKVD